VLTLPCRILVPQHEHKIDDVALFLSPARTADSVKAYNDSRKARLARDPSDDNDASELAGDAGNTKRTPAKAKAPRRAPPGDSLTHANRFAALDEDCADVEDSRAGAGAQAAPAKALASSPVQTLASLLKEGLRKKPAKSGNNSRGGEGAGSASAALPDQATGGGSLLPVTKDSIEDFPPLSASSPPRATVISPPDSRPTGGSSRVPLLARSSPAAPELLPDPPIMPEPAPRDCSATVGAATAEQDSVQAESEESPAPSPAPSTSQPVPLPATPEPVQVAKERCTPSATCDDDGPKPSPDAPAPEMATDNLHPRETLGQPPMFFPYHPQPYPSMQVSGHPLIQSCILENSCSSLFDPTLCVCRLCPESHANK
jgi:hypothetical protein